MLAEVKEITVVWSSTFSIEYVVCCLLSDSWLNHVIVARDYFSSGRKMD